MFAGAHGLARRVDEIAPAVLRAAQHTDHAPHTMIMYRGFLPRPPDEADDRKSSRGISVKQILLIMIGMRLGIGGWQPIIVGDEASKGGAYGLLGGGLAEGVVHGGDEAHQGIGRVHAW